MSIIRTLKLKTQKISKIFDLFFSPFIQCALFFVGILLSGCSYINNPSFDRSPAFSAVRADLGHKHSQNNSASFHHLASNKNYSLFSHGSTSFYRDPRATHPGDILTILIAINDRASVNNKTDLKRNTDTGYSFGGNIASLSDSALINAGSKNTTKGDAKVERRENIQLSIAALVTDTLPNGNLVINGSQEVRVNDELRILNIVGVVRPRDIAGNNTINYDKIAEARISYGGRGRMSEIQQSPYGQQFLNRIMPF